MILQNHMNKGLVKVIVGALVVGAVGFWGGMQYQKSQTPVAQSGSGTFTRGAGRGAGGGAGGGFTTGSIISNDGTSITIQMQSGSTKVVLVSPSTSVMKTVAGKIVDLRVGTNVSVTGTANTDGSVTAQMIQLRPAFASSTANTARGQ